MLQRLNLRAFHFLFHQLKVSVAIVEPKRFWRYELKDGLKGGIELLPCEYKSWNTNELLLERKCEKSIPQKQSPPYRLIIVFI